MTKRIIALLLALILTVGLLPTVALAATTDSGTLSDGTAAVGAQSSTVESGTDSDNNDDNPVHVIKTFTPGENGKYGSLTLEAYVTNPLQVVTETVPMDIVLVLDQSGSMGHCINCGAEFYYNTTWQRDNCNKTAATYEYKAVSRDKASHSKTYYVVAYGQYREAKWCDRWNHNHYAGWYYDGYYGHTRVDSTTTLYERVVMTGHKHRLDALTEALNTFVDSVVENGGDHNVAVVGYAGGDYNGDKYSSQNSELLTGTDLKKGSQYTDNDHRYYPQDLNKVPINGKNYSDLDQNSDEYSSALQSMKSPAGVANVRAAINALTANGATRTYAGMDMAKNILAKAKTANSNRQQVVILFTDGKTNSDGQNVYSLADQMKNNNVLIYTVGLFSGADQTDSKDDENKFLNRISNNSKLYSNNHPANTPASKADKTYYLPAQDAASLSAVFEQISKEVSKLDLKVGSTAVLQDTLSGYFTFDADTNAEGSIIVQTADFEGIDANGQMQWGTPENATGTKVEVNGKKITVTGFDYGSSENLVTVHETGDPKYTGKKLIVTIPIKPDTNSNVTWTAGPDLYDTNVKEGDKAGLGQYGYQDKTGTLSTTLPTSPKAPVTGYTVSYSVTGGDNTCSTVAAEDNNKVYIEGQKYNVLGKLTDTTGKWSFTGWKANADYSGDDVSGEKTMGTANVTYYGKWENATVNDVDLAPYVKKTLTGDLPAGYKETFTAKITGDGITATDGLEITTDEFNAADTKTFKGTDATKVDLTIGTEYVYTVTEVVPDSATPGMTYGQDVKFALKATNANTIEFYTVSADGTKTKVNETANQFVTITNTYNPTGASLALAGKFQKHLTSNTTTLPTGANSFELKITGTSENTDKSEITGTATVSNLTGSGTSYNGSADFGSFKKGTEPVETLTFNAAGTYTYKVQETNSSVAGMTYDTTEYTLTVVVADENNDGALEITSAEVTKPGTTDRSEVVADLMGTPNDTFTITNTFKGAELPLDPTPDPEDSDKLIPKIVKTLRVTNGSAAPTTELPFTVTVYEGNMVDEAKKVATGTATIPAGSVDNTTVNFTKLGTLVFPKAGDYTYTIKETKGNTNGVTYDEKTYTLKVEVTAVNNVLTVTNAGFTYTDGETEYIVSDIRKNPITITNVYTEPKNPSVVSKAVVTTNYQFPDGLDNAIAEFKSIHKIDEVLYPVGNGTTDNTLEVNKGTTSVTLLYAITVNKGTESNTMGLDDDGATFVFAVGADVAPGSSNHFDVTFNDGISTAVIYVAKTHTPLNFVGGKCTVENVISEEIKATTTVTEKDPNKLYIDFSDFVKKELTATGTKTASDVDFTVDVKGKEQTTIITSAEGEEAISTYADEFDPKYSRTLTAHFDSITGGETKTVKFTGNTIEIDHAGTYVFELSEVDGQRNGVTYDKAEYRLWIFVNLSKETNELYISGATAYKYNEEGLQVETIQLYTTEGELARNDNYLTFHNTIDTGKDDYYPIIIPTIIGKDTGMLNKTDHFAYVIGYPDGTVHPNGQITRAEVATIFFRLLRDEVRDGAFTTSNSYSDVAYGKWYNNPISTMSALGIITGYPDGTFKPDKPITRAEFAAIAARFDETQSGKSATFSDVIGHWAAKEIGIAYYNDWIKGYPDGTFKPDQNITRAEAMTLINRVLERKPESPADLLTDMNIWTDNMDTSKWYYLDVQEATNSHGYTRKTFNYELWRQMLNDPDWSRYER